MKLARPATMHSNQQAPAILACSAGDSCLKRVVISDLLIVVTPDSSRILTAKRLRLEAQGCRCGYPGFEIEWSGQPQRGCGRQTQPVPGWEKCV